jgi:uncharacterized membrane protein
MKQSSIFTQLSHQPYLLGAWILIAVYVILYILIPDKHSLILIVFSLIIAFTHGSQRYGLKAILFLFFISNIVGIIFENCSISTGFPFGHYYYSNFRHLPEIGQVPIHIGLLYFAMGYMSWTIANVILDKADERFHQKINLYALPIVASFIMTFWDVVMDPTSSTVFKTWIWEDGGGFFGVPLSNYLGWILVVWLFFQGFAIYLSKRPQLIKVNELTKVNSYWFITITFYFLIAFSYVINYMKSPKVPEVLDNTGQVWKTKDLNETSVLMAIFTMGFAVVLATLKLMYNKKVEQKNSSF